MALTTQVGIEFIARNRANAQISSFNRSLARMGRQMLAIAGAGGGLYAFKRGFDSVIGAAMTQQKAERELMAATEGSINSFKVYAAEMQKLTIYGDEQIISQMAYAANLGVTRDKLKEAATAAIGLAARFRIDLSSAMMLVGRAAQGQTQLLTRYGIVIDQNLPDQDKFNELLRIGADSLKLAEAAAQDAEGSLSQLKNTYSDFLEVIGEPLLEALQKNATATKKWMESNKTGVSRWIGNMAEGVDMVKKMDKAVYDFYRKYSLPGLIFPKEKPPPAPALGPTNARAAEKAAEMAAWERNKPEMEAHYKRMVELLRQRKESAKIQDKYLPALEREIAITGRIGEAHWHAAKMVDFENAIKKAGITDQQTLNHLTEEYALKLKQLEKAQQLARIADDIGSAFTNAFEDAIFEAKKFDEIMRQVIRSIARSVMQNLIFQPAGLAITGGIKDIMAKLFNTGGALASAPVQPAGQYVYSYPGMQHGGLARRPMITAIAEREPELVTPLSELKGGGLLGGGSVVINLNYLGQPMGIDGYSQRMEEDKRIIDVWASNVVRGGQAKQVMLEVINNNVE